MVCKSALRIKYVFRWQLAVVLVIHLLLLLSCDTETTDIAHPHVTSLTKISLNVDSTIQWRWMSCKVDIDTLKGLQAQVKGRGGTSRRYKKHSFALELDESRSVGGLQSDDDWVLNASVVDRTFMRNRLAYDLFAKFGSNNLAAQSTFVNVYINNNYTGLYHLCHEINGGYLNINKEDTMAMVFEAPPIFYEKKLEKVRHPENYYHQKFPHKKEKDFSSYLEGIRSFIF